MDDGHHPFAAGKHCFPLRFPLVAKNGLAGRDITDA